MVNLSERNRSDWVAELGAVSQPGGSSSALNASPSWFAALGLGEPHASGGFREISPFAALAGDPEPETVSAPRPEPETPTAPRVSPEEEAYMRGYAEGHADATRKGDVALAEERARYRDLRLAFRALDAAALGALATDLNATVRALCDQVLGEYAIDGEALAARCHTAAKRLGAGPSDVTVHLHPATRKRIDADAFLGWTFEEDTTLAQGALRLTSADGSVREGPEDWMRAVSEALGA